MKERGKFIVFEGIGGCGKSTQMGPARAHLESLGYKVVTTREPGGTTSGEDIRQLIFKLKGANLIDGGQQQILFFGSRYILVKRVVAPNIKKGKIVLSDRFSPSTGAFQGYGEGADMLKILATADVVLGDYKPDAVVLFDISPQTAILRKKDDKDNDPFDRLKIEYFEKVVNGYRQMASEGWGGLKWYVVDGEPPAHEVTEELKKTLEKIISSKIAK